MSIRETFLIIGSRQVYVKSWLPAQERSAVPIVLLHDSLGSVDLWRNFPEQLATATGRQVIAYDRPGFGRSDARFGLPDHDFVREAATVHFPEIKRQLGLNRFVVFGHSVGGGMALLIAAHHAESCLAVVTESAQAFLEERTLQGIQAAKKKFQQPGQLDRLKKWHGDKAQWVLDAWTEIWLSQDFRDWTLEPDLKQVRCPVLVLHGSQDEYGSVRFPRLIGEQVGGPATVHILEGVGHLPHREREAEVLHWVRDFLKGI